MLVKVFTKCPRLPGSVAVYTDSKFDNDDTTMSFVKQFVQKTIHESLNNRAKRAATVSIKKLTTLYSQYVYYEKLGIPKLAKHMKETLKRLGFNIVRTKSGVVVRGIVLNIAKLKRIYQQKQTELGE